MIDFKHLVLWLSPRKVMGSYWPDLSKYKNNGRIYGAQLRHGAIYLNGTSSYIEIERAILPCDDNLTIEIWMYPLVITGIHALYIETTGTGGHTRNYIVQDDDCIFFDQYPPSGGGLLTPAGTLTRGKWFHVAVTVAKPHRAIYINGEVIVSDDAAEDYGGSEPTNTRVGYRGENSPSFFQGLIGDLLVYNIARTGEQIRIDAELTSPYGTR